MWIGVGMTVYNVLCTIVYTFFARHESILTLCIDLTYAVMLSLDNCMNVILSKHVQIVTLIIMAHDAKKFNIFRWFITNTWLVGLLVFC